VQSSGATILVQLPQSRLQTTTALITTIVFPAKYMRSKITKSNSVGTKEQDQRP
jgi:hypothetical protein